MTLNPPASLPRVLVGVGPRPLLTVTDHEAAYGRFPDIDALAPERIIATVEASGLRGHGGAAFPVARKLQAVAGRRGAKVVVGNGTEGEPASKKDRALMRTVPHLILEGAAAAARSTGARNAIIALDQDDDEAFECLQLAIGERDRTRSWPKIELVGVPDSFITGQESALVNYLDGGDARPSFGTRPFERGVRRQPTLVQNVETLAHIALLMRHGPRWFRTLGTDDDPGTALVTVSGAIERPGVYEIEHGQRLSQLMHTAGVTEPLRAVLLGGYFGAWAAAEELVGLELAPTLLRPAGLSLGAGVVVALGTSACPVAEVARVADYLAGETAGQCGPCVHGLAAVADAVQHLAAGNAGRRAWSDLERWLTEIPGRGACQFPDGASRFIASSLRVFRHEFAAHAHRGPCPSCRARPVLPVPALTRAPR